MSTMPVVTIEQVREMLERTKREMLETMRREAERHCKPSNAKPKQDDNNTRD